MIYGNNKDDFFCFFIFCVIDTLAASLYILCHTNDSLHSTTLFSKAAFMINHQS